MQKLLFKILSFIFILFVEGIKAQDFQLFFSNRFYFYEFEKAGEIHIETFKADTFLMSGNDSVFSNYTRENDDYLYSVPINQFIYYSDTSWSGYRCLIKSSGENILFTRYSDSLLFIPTAPLGTSWNFCSFQNGDKFIATVSSLTSDSVFGFADSVKKISIERVDSIGNIVPDSLNNFEFALSKNFGLLTTVNIKHFPNQTNIYQLTGIDSLAGEKRMSPETIFNYEIGDVFHYDNTEQLTLGTWKHELIKRKVISKTVLSNSVDYIIEDSVFTSTQFPDFTYTQTFNDSTFPLSYSFDINYHDSLFTKLPHRKDFGGNNYVSTWHRSVNNRRSIYTVPCIGRATNAVPGSIYRSFGSCIFTQCDFPGGNNSFVEGLGVFFTIASFDSSSGTHTCRKMMVYYEKGSEIYGTPVNFPVLSTDVIALSPIQDEINLFPNPVTGYAIIENGSNINSIQLYDSQGGEVVLKWNREDKKITLNCENLPSGIYFLLVNRKGIIRYTKMSVINN